MSDIAIRCEHLSKRYRIGERESYKALRDVISDAAASPFRRLRSALSNNGRSRNGSALNTQHSALGADTGHPTSDTQFWALDDVSFDVNRGEVVGIIGRNGAGKSTLLKILSRITKPTKGRAQINGRVGSLLEVGTGFHPELSGRENIYLNAAILGMRKADITSKFDEIVAFAEIEKFIDTPVKRYSSGMYVRLAFAVAAHLEPEILIIDEVLAVGDAEFQKKCLGKMGEVSEHGRTVLFVSHNLQAIQSLCRTSYQLEAGRIANQGESQTVVARYLSSTSQISGELRWPIGEAPGTEEVKLLALSVTTKSGGSSGIYSSKDDICVEMEFVASTTNPALCVGFDLVTGEGVMVARTYQTDMLSQNWPRVRVGQNKWRCVIPKGLLNAGLFYVCPKIGIHCQYWIVNLDPTVQFEVVLDHGDSPFWNVLDKTTRPGIIAPILEWTHEANS